jgi:hypothetical protein
MLEICVFVKGQLNTLSLTQWSPFLTLYTTIFDTKNSTFCPHSVLMCLVWISEQTAIIYVYNINRNGVFTARFELHV